MEKNSSGGSAINNDLIRNEQALERHGQQFDQKNAFAAFRHDSEGTGDKKKDDGSDTEEELMDLVSMSSFTTN